MSPDSESAATVASPPNSLRRRIRQIAYLGSPAIYMLAVGIALLVVEFQLLRLLLWWVHRDLGSSTDAALLVRSFVVGFRFDFAVAAYAALPLYVLARMIHHLLGIRWERRFYVVGLVVLGASFGLLGCAELEFYREFFSRYNSLALHYWSQPGTVLRMIWYGYPVLRYLAALTVAVSFYAVFVRAVARRVLHDHATPQRRRWSVELFQLAAVVAVLVTLARGGWRSTPLKWGDAMHCDSTFANQLALNGAWTLGNAILNSQRHDQLERLWEDTLPLEVATRRTRALLFLPDNERVGDGRTHPLLRVSDHPTGRLALRKNGSTAPNVVIIVMESFSARFVGACGSDDDYTPEFNRLAREGVLYDRCFSVGTHTHQANVAVFAGFPNLPGYESLMENYQEGSQAFDSLPRAFKQLGYRTSFFYNGDLAWENMEGFFRVQGIQHFIQRKDFDRQSHFDHTWGVSDDDLFLRLDEELSRAPEPFFTAVLTLSNHAPFELPRPLPFSEVTDQGSMNPRLNGIRYADWALGRFFERARRRPYFRNTLFVLVGDHGISVAPILTDLHLLAYHVPLLFYAPELLGREGKRIHCVASQLDIAPTVLALAGDRAPHQHWGRDLFSLPLDDPGLAVFKPSACGGAVGLARGDWLLVRPADGRSQLYRYSLDFPARATPDESHPEILRNLDADLHAFLTTATSVLRRHRAVYEESVR